MEYELDKLDKVVKAGEGIVECLLGGTPILPVMQKVWAERDRVYQEAKEVAKCTRKQE